jgi:hypothetical protein
VFVDMGHNREKGDEKGKGRDEEGEGGRETMS